MLNYKIMVVDDDEILQFTSKMLLKSLIPVENIQQYTNPLKALKFLQASQGDKSIMPDLILLDINMPVMDGFELLDFMKDSVTTNIPVVFMVSSSNSPNDINKAATYKVVKEYLGKPIDVAIIEEKIKKHLG